MNGQSHRRTGLVSEIQQFPADLVAAAGSGLRTGERGAVAQPPTADHGACRRQGRAAVKDVPDRPRHQLAAGKGWLGYPVVQGDVHGKDGVLCPVTNMDDRDWRQRHRQGGDFMIYTDRLTVRLASPIRVFL